MKRDKNEGKLLLAAGKVQIATTDSKTARLRKAAGRGVANVGHADCC